MKQEKWNPEDWQGRSKRQVEDSHKIMDWALTALGLALFGWVLFQVVINITY